MNVPIPGSGSVSLTDVDFMTEGDEGCTLHAAIRLTKYTPKGPK
jgi:hypothetical protein